MLSTILIYFKIFNVVIKQIYNRIRFKCTALIHRRAYQPGYNPRNIVIVGASFAGYHAAYCLANSIPSGYRIIVVERNSHFQLTWVLPRFCTVSGHEEKVFIPYGGYLKNVPEGVSAKEGYVSGQVQLGSGELVDYDYLVLATGCSGSLPSRVGEDTKGTGIMAIRNEQERLKAGKDIVVLGGGPAGIELAADAKTQYPEKNVTLMHSRETLLNSHFGQKLKDMTLKELEDIDATVILGERATLSEGSEEVVLSSGEPIKCDCLIKCVGQKPNSGLLDSIFSSSISPSGHIEVRPSLQITDPECNRIYAAGDVINMGNVNGRSAIEQAQVVAQNIVRGIKGHRLIEYHPQWWEGVTKLTLGLNKNVVYMINGSAEVALSIKNKSIELDSARVWKLFGAKPYWS